VGHEIDNIPSGGQLGSVGGARNPFNGALDRGDGAIDRRQNLHLVAVYNLPFGKGQHFLHGGNPVVDAVLGGWSLSTIYTLTTGAPLSVTGSNCSTPGITSTCEASLNPNYTGGNGGIQLEPWGYGNVIGGTAQVYVNKGAFVDPALYTFGNAPRSDPFNLRAPTLWNDDVKLRKDFKIREKYSLQLAFDFFNIFNAVVFSPLR